MTLASSPADNSAQPSWRHLLLAAVRPEFRADVYVPDSSDPVLFGAACQVAGCRGRGHLGASVELREGEYLCEPHGAMWRRDGHSELGEWLRGAARPVRTQRVATPCAVERCSRSVDQNGYCGEHQRRWRKLGRPDREEFSRTAKPASTPTGSCTVGDCEFPAAGRWALCDTHRRSWKFLQGSRPEMDQAGYVAHLAEARLTSVPRFDLSGLPRVLALELQFVLQVRHDARTKQLTPHAFRALTGWVLAVGADSLLDHDEDWWSTSARQRFCSGTARRPLALLRLARRHLSELREETIEVWGLDRWPVARIDPDGRWAYQPTRYVAFFDIEPPWLKALAKRWARWRLSTASKSPRSLESFTAGLRRFVGWLEAQDTVPQTPGELTRELLERFLAAVAVSELGPANRRAVIGELKVFLDEVRMHGWEPTLPTNAVYLRGELPRASRPVPRFIDEFVMGQIEAPENLARLPDLTTQTAVLMLIETGLRSIDARLLPFDPVTVDEAGAPYLLFTNHKLSREAVIPISQRLLEQVRRQQAHVRERWPDAPRRLLPRPKANPDGKHPLSRSALRGGLSAWLAECDIRDASGREVHVTPHQFRHTLGTRLINNEVSIHTVQRLLDHASPEMTARYATIKDQTLRREWDRYQERVNVRGEVLRLDPDGPLSDAAWAKENLARAKQTLPNGYCGLPLQQQCPHPNACLTCDAFLTTAEFLPIHIEQLERTTELIATAKTDGKDRLVEMNEPVRLNLVRIIEGLESLKHGEGEGGEASDAA